MYASYQNLLRNDKCFLDGSKNELLRMIFQDSFLMINDAKNASSKLSGTAKISKPAGKTPRLPITTHIKTNPINQENKVVCSKVNFLDMIKTEMAKNSDQSPQIAPLTGSAGNISPSFS